MIPEIAQRATELEQKIQLLKVDVEQLPLHAPLRELKEKQLETAESEYRRLMNDLFDAQGQGQLFGSEEAGA